MLALFISALFLSSVIGENQPPCCFPTQTFGNVNVTKGGNTWFMPGARFAIGDDLQRVIFLHPTKDDVFILETGQGEDGIGWRYHRDESGKCTKKSTYASQEFPTCFPENRKFVKTGLDAHGWPLVTWEYQEFGKTSQMIVHAKSGCVPQEIRRWINNPADTVVYRFYNMSNWKVDTNLLHPDTHDCKDISHQD